MKYYIDRTNNDIYAYESDGSQDDYIKEGLELLTDEGLQQARIQQENSIPYTDKRKLAYPSLEEQADMAYWDRQNGTTTLDDAISAVKLKFPKPKP